MAERIIGLGKRILPDGMIAEDAASYFHRLGLEEDVRMSDEVRKEIDSHYSRANNPIPNGVGQRHTPSYKAVGLIRRDYEGDLGGDTPKNALRIPRPRR